MFKRWIKSLIVPPARSRAPHAARRYRLRSEALEDRTVPAGNFATGAAFGEAPIVRVFDGNTRQQVAAIQVFDTGFRGGVNVAMGDVTGDGVADVVAGSALGFSHVKVFDGVTFQQVSSFMVFDRFAGGINVAAGDIDGDGKADLAVAVANGGGTHVKAFSGADGSELASFFAYGQGFVGGVNVTLGDVDGDGKADIVTGAGPGSGGHVKVFDGATGSEFRSFLVFAGFSGSIDLSVGDTNGDGKAEVLVGAGPGAGPHVKAYDGATGALDASFFAFAEAFLGGVSVGVDADGHIVVAGTGRSHVKTFDGVTGAELSSALIQGSASGRIGTAPEPTALTITSSATASAAENQTAVLTVTTSRTATYRIAGGADAALFAIDPTTGVLTFVTAPDFEEPADAGTNNVYDVTVEATNGTATTTQAIAVTVTDVNESTALAITSGAAVSVTENQTAVRTVTTSGGSGAPVTYSIVAVGSGGGCGRHPVRHRPDHRRTHLRRGPELRDPDRRRHEQRLQRDRTGDRRHLHHLPGHRRHRHRHQRRTERRGRFRGRERHNAVHFCGVGFRILRYRRRHAAGGEDHNPTRTGLAATQRCGGHHGAGYQRRGHWHLDVHGTDGGIRYRVHHLHLPGAGQRRHDERGHRSGPDPQDDHRQRLRGVIGSCESNRAPAAVDYGRQRRARRRSRSTHPPPIRVRSSRVETARRAGRRSDRRTAPGCR